MFNKPEVIQSSTPPEIVALGGQTLEEVEKILKESKKYVGVYNVNKIKNFIQSTAKPEIVALGGQTLEEVEMMLGKELGIGKEKVVQKFPSDVCGQILEEINTQEFNWRKSAYYPHHYWGNDETYNKDINEIKEFIKKTPKFTFENAPVCGEECTIRGEDGCGPKKNADMFSYWRRLADVACKEEVQIPATKQLIYNLTNKLNTKYPQLIFTWSKDDWNEQLLIHDCPTCITVQNITLAYDGLMKIVDKAAAQDVIIDIILKKMQSVFV